MSTPNPNNFFNVHRSFSEIKQEIFGKYFDVWCQTCLGKVNEGTSEPALFIDMHTGEEQTEGNALFQLDIFQRLYKSIIKRPLLNQKLHSFYYNKDKQTLDKTQESIDALPYFQELFHPSIPLNNSENKTVMGELLEKINPSLIFLDPFQGGLAQQVLLQAINLKKSDIFMLLRPENITKAIAGKSVSKTITELFGKHLQKINYYSQKEKDRFRRQEFILGHFTSLLQEKENYTLLFKVNLPDTAQPEHYLLFVTPNSQSYRSFKEIILPYCTFQEDGVPVFIANEYLQAQTTLFEKLPEFTIANLVARISDQGGIYKYKSIENIYEADSIGTNYSRDNYLASFEQLQRAGKVEFLNASTRQTIKRPTLSSIVKFTL